jgi:hypothetical protein
VHLNDIKKIKNALETATGTKKERLLKQLLETPFLRALIQEMPKDHIENLLSYILTMRVCKPILMVTQMSGFMTLFM